MKKLLFTIAVMLQLASGSGMVVHLHYCMGKMVNWELTNTKKDHCPRCGMPTGQTSKGCCSDENRFYKYTGDQQTVSGFTGIDKPEQFSAVPLFNIPASSISVLFHNLQPPTSNLQLFTGPPPLYLQHRVFRI